MVQVKMLELKDKVFREFVSELLSGKDPDEMSVPECGNWHDVAESFHYQYDQYYLTSGADRAASRIAIYIRRQMKNDPDMYTIIGSLFSINDEITIKDELSPTNVAAEDDEIGSILQKYAIPELKKTSYTYEDGHTEYIDPYIPKNTTMNSRFLNEFMKWATEYAVRSHPVMLEAVGVWLLSVVAARRIKIAFEDGENTPFYIVLCAKSSEYAKSYAARTGVLLLKASKLKWLLIANNMTPPMFMRENNPELPSDYDMLEDEEMEVENNKQRYAGKFSLFFDEMGIHFSNMLQPSGTYSAYLQWILELDGCPDELTYYTVKHNKLVIKKPYLSLLGCMTLDDWKKIPKGSANPFGRGLMARWTPITPPPLKQPILAVTSVEAKTVPGDLVQMLRSYHQDLGEPEFTFVGEGEERRTKIVSFPENETTITKEVKDAYEQYQKALTLMVFVHRQEIPENLHASYIRLATKAMRIAAMLAWMHNSGTISLDEWHDAQLITERWRYSLHEFYNQVSAAPEEPTEERKKEDRLLLLIRNEKFKGWVKPYMLAPYLNQSTAQVREQLEALKLAGVLAYTPIYSKNNRAGGIYYDPTMPVPEQYIGAMPTNETTK